MAILDSSTGILPPQNLEAERAILGAMLLNRQAVLIGIEALRSIDFYRPEHSKIFNAITSLFNHESAVDLVTVVDELRKLGTLEAVGGEGGVAAVCDSVASVANAEYYCRIVREKSMLRQMIDACSEVVGDCYRSQEPARDLLNKAQSRIFELNQSSGRKTFVAVRDVLHDTFRSIQDFHDRKMHITGLASGFADLDSLTAGFQKGDLIILAGRPSMGKTSFCLNVAENIAINPHGPKLPVAIFSLEMSTESLVQRLLCSHAKISAHLMRTGYLTREHMKTLAMKAGDLDNSKIYIDDSGSSNIMEIRAKSRRLKMEHPDLALIIVDYLQLISGAPGGSESRQQEVSQISRALKAMAKELQLPVMALSQLSRAVESRGGSGRPLLSDLRECVVGDTLVTLASGRRVPIRELVGMQPEVFTMFPDGKIGTAASDKVWRVGRKAVFEVTLASGRRIRATAKHRLFGAGGWVRVSDLAVGDRLAIARTIPEPKVRKEWPELRLALLGQLIGDGSYLSHQPMRYTTASEENSEIVTRAAREEFGAKVTRYKGRGTWHQLLISGNGNRWHPAGVNQWLRELGVFGQRSKEKRVPAEVFELPNSQIALLLRHLWATDGCIHTRAEGQRGSHRVYFATCSRGLAEDVAALLLRLGLVARIQTVRQGKYDPVFNVVLSSTEQHLNFAQTIGAFGPRVLQLERLVSRIRQVNANPNVDTLPEEVFGEVRQLMAVSGMTPREMANIRGVVYSGNAHFKFSPSRRLVAEYAEVLNSDSLRSKSQSDLFWDRIVTIETCGEEDVFDLTVPGPASWLADSVITHNSGSLEQDSDLVMFVYRSGYYKAPAERTPEEMAKAEIIVAKQRNGPTDNVHMVFLSECTRFETAARKGDEEFA